MVKYLASVSRCKLGTCILSSAARIIDQWHNDQEGRSVYYSVTRIFSINHQERRKCLPVKYTARRNNDQEGKSIYNSITRISSLNQQGQRKCLLVQNLVCVNKCWLENYILSPTARINNDQEERSLYYQITRIPNKQGVPACVSRCKLANFILSPTARINRLWKVALGLQGSPGTTSPLSAPAPGGLADQGFD